MRLTRFHRRGIAATELALLAPILLTLLMGIWEVGRVIMVRNLLEETAREGSRLAASGSLFASNQHITPEGKPLTLISPSKNEDFEVQRRILVYLQGNGISTQGATVTIRNYGSESSPKNWVYTWNSSGDSSGSGFDPAAAADQLDHLEVTVTLPYRNVAWSPLNWFISSSTTLTATVRWRSMRDVPFHISTVIPTKPIQPTDPLP